MSTQQQQASSSSSSSSDKININLIELKETVDRIASYNGVEIVQILNTSGDIIAECVNSNNNNSNNIRLPMATPTSNTNSVTSSSDFGNDDMTLAASSHTGNNASLSTASSAHTLLRTAHQYIQNFKKENDSNNDNDEITFIQIRSKNGYELMIAPHFGYALVVVKLIA